MSRKGLHPRLWVPKWKCQSRSSLRRQKGSRSWTPFVGSFLHCRGRRSGHGVVVPWLAEGQLVVVAVSIHHPVNALVLQDDCAGPPANALIILLLGDAGREELLQVLGDFHEPVVAGLHLLGLLNRAPDGLGDAVDLRLEVPEEGREHSGRKGVRTSRKENRGQHVGAEYLVAGGRSMFEGLGHQLLCPCSFQYSSCCVPLEAARMTRLPSFREDELPESVGAVGWNCLKTWSMRLIVVSSSEILARGATSFPPSANSSFPNFFLDRHGPRRHSPLDAPKPHLCVAQPHVEGAYRLVLGVLHVHEGLHEVAVRGLAVVHALPRSIRWILSSLSCLKRILSALRSSRCRGSSVSAVEVVHEVCVESWAWL